MHARLVLAAVDEVTHEYIILTLDDDLYLEVLDASNEDFVHFLGAGPKGGLPRGVSARNVYGFAPMTAAQLGNTAVMKPMDAREGVATCCDEWIR